tara:strand:+ start:267 stop:500 length:234 start_codon:yes stop_codon:yes gene_type:complete
MTIEIEKYKTSDLSIAAFLMMKGMVLSNAYRNPTGQFMFEFDDPTTSGVKYAIEFASSDCAVYDNHVRNLKKILYRN